MTSKFLGVLSVYVFMVNLMLPAVSLAGCNNPNGPGKVDENNPPPGPGESVRATLHSWGVYEGECPNDPSGCSRHLEETSESVNGSERTFLFRRYDRKHTLILCVNHPRVPGRSLILLAKAWRSINQVMLSEGNIESPACIATVFDFLLGNGSTNTASGEIKFYESDQDLFTPTDWKISLGFRVCVTPEGYLCPVE